MRARLEVDSGANAEKKAEEGARNWLQGSKLRRRGGFTNEENGEEGREVELEGMVWARRHQKVRWQERRKRKWI